MVGDACGLLFHDAAVVHVQLRNARTSHAVASRRPRPGLWEGSWQATWSGRLQNELTHIAEDIDGRADLDRASRGRRRTGTATGRLRCSSTCISGRTSVGSGQQPVEPYERAHVTRDSRPGVSTCRAREPAPVPVAHLAKRLARGVFLLWAGEIPFRYSDINGLPPLVIRLCWSDTGPHICSRGDRRPRARPRDPAAGAGLMAAPIIYVTVVHALLFTEARQSLPAQPVLLFSPLWGPPPRAARSHHALFAVEPQVHEGQHL